MAANPRIDDLRKRLEKEPGSRLFAQLAEELRKDGELEDALRIARDGLQKHPAYPSARMTLGRALLDTGDWAAARTEFEIVLKSAADNILASRYLAECLENLGERDAAIARYKSTLAMAPGEKHVVARLQELEKGGGAAAAPVPAGARAPEPRAPAGLRPASPRPVTGAVPQPSIPMAMPTPPAPPPSGAAPPPPIPLSTVEGEMELETSHPSATAGRGSTPPPAPLAFAPIPLVAADEAFELERPYESPVTGIGTAAERPSTAPVAPAATAPASSEDQEFELEAPHEAPSVAWAATIRPLPFVDEPPPTRAIAPPPSSAAPPSFAAPAPPSGAAKPMAEAAEPLVPATLTSPTLGELYFNQGFTDKAIEVYRDLTVREPENERVGARLKELEKIQRSLSGGPAPYAATATPTPPPPSAPAPPPPVPPPPSPDPAAERRDAIERTIARLEGLLAAVRKG